MDFKLEQFPRYAYVQLNGAGPAYIDPLPGDSDIGVVNGVWVPEDMRKQGIGTAQHKERLAFMARSFLYALCTVNNYNEAELKILEANGWEKIKQLQYSSIWIRDLSDLQENK